MSKKKNDDDWTTRQVGRLALRHEGKWWKAYYALPDTMQGAILLGTVAFVFIEDHQERMDAFMDLMREAVADILEEKTGSRPEWSKPHRAPESERSGHA